MTIEARNGFVILQSTQVEQTQHGRLYVPGKSQDYVGRVVRSAAAGIEEGDIVIVGEPEKIKKLDINNTTYIVVPSTSIAGVIR